MFNTVVFAPVARRTETPNKGHCIVTCDNWVLWGQLLILTVEMV